MWVNSQGWRLWHSSLEEADAAGTPRLTFLAVQIWGRIIAKRAACRKCELRANSVNCVICGKSIFVELFMTLSRPNSCQVPLFAQEQQLCPAIDPHAAYLPLYP